MSLISFVLFAAFPDSSSIKSTTNFAVSLSMNSCDFLHLYLNLLESSNFYLIFLLAWPIHIRVILPISPPPLNNLNVYRLLCNTFINNSYHLSSFFTNCLTNFIRLTPKNIGIFFLNLTSPFVFLYFQQYLLQQLLNKLY